MQQNSFTTIIIQSDENCYLTQLDESIELKDRIVAERVALGKFDTPENWVEITKEKGDEIRSEQENLRKGEENERDTK